MKLEDRVEKGTSGIFNNIRKSRVYQKAAYVISALSLYSNLYAAKDNHIPQIANGLGIKTEILLNNPGNNVDNGTLYIYESNGNPYNDPITLKNPAGDSTVFLNNGELRYSINPGGSAKFVTSGVGAIKIGHAKASSDYDNSETTASSTYILPPNGIVSTSGMPSSQRYNAPAEKDITENKTSGYAFSNFTDKDLSLTLRLLDFYGNELSKSNLNVPRRGQSAKLLEELFSNVPGKLQGAVHATTNDGKFSMSAIGLIYPNILYGLTSSPTAYSPLAKVTFEGLDVVNLKTLNAQNTKWNICGKEYQGNPITLELPKGECQVSFSSNNVFDYLIDFRKGDKLADSVGFIDATRKIPTIKFDEDEIRLYGVGTNNGWLGEVGPAGHVFKKEYLTQTIAVRTQGKLSHYKDPGNIASCYVKIANGPDAVVKKEVQDYITWYNSQVFVRKNKIKPLKEGLQPECNQNSVVVTIDNIGQTGPIGATSFLGSNINIAESWLNTDNFFTIPLPIQTVSAELYEITTDSDDRDGVFDPQTPPKKPLLALDWALFKTMNTHDIKDLKLTEFGKTHMAFTDQMPSGMKVRIE